ncbi:BREX-1 system adenine-specific DNA-methyltransferase PglX [Clostridium algidicarnis]|uniref:BREX-1 system adenine-specific DNA-methyltransferase PglX n=1 Tax=Clostridium algidicarnis TaxID=37659 RepID=UPI001CF59652|nr:BREX-1 system adenine-specific DNA-methyltransferase PglX [Clostridium algidicarnis]MCB2287641.1 BREX-1 system adenine-specific DNA-methyltransferase PglX [Clostridium algidicarnis]
MDKNKIKSFAIWARRNLIGAVSERANRIGVTENKIEESVAVQGGFKLEGNDEIFKLSKDHREKLVREVNEKGFEQVMEEVAYTWFNRFMGLRYMEVNEYLPTGVRVLSSEVEGKTEPDVLTRVSEVIDELNLKSEYIYELLDSGKTEDREEAYKHILVRQCNELGKIIPQMFEKISDYTELLLPDNLLEEGSVIRKMVEDIVEEDWKEEVEIIGWMYQYYISEKKDEVFAALKKNVKITKENIPAATQLFTPKWIVKYMVENSLGRLWLEKLEGDSEQAGVGSGQWAVISDELKSKWKYYLEEAEQEPEGEEELKKIREEHSKLKPEDIKVLDTCMGSGHILVYAFDVLYEIYKTAGYSEREIPRMILQNNLYGLDIDDRAAQLASFALIMKARSFNRRLFRDIERESLELNLCSIQESNSLGREEIDYFCTLGKGLDSYELRNAMEYLCETFTDAKEYGSILEVKRINFQVLKDRLYQLECEYELTFADNRKILLEKLPVIIKQAEIMSRKYEVCATNPPYMGNKGINDKIKNYIEDKYKDVKGDLFSVYMKRNIEYTKKYGNLGFMTPMVWMFLSSYEELRDLVTNHNSIMSLVHLEYSAFEEATVPLCLVTLKNSNKYKNGVYIRLTDFVGGMEIQHKKYLECVDNSKCDFRYINNSKNFCLIPGNPIAYWASNKIIDIFSKEKSLEYFAEPRQGMATSDNNRFLRSWWEIENKKIGFSIKSNDEAINSTKKWFPYNKGGEFRKWYGNNEFLLNWENDGQEVKSYAAKLYKSYTRTIKNIPYYFKEGITYTFISSSSFGVRYSSSGFIFDVAGSTIFPENKYIRYLLAFLCSKLSYEFLKMQNPTLNFQVGNIKKLPLIMEKSEFIDTLTDENIYISKKDWDSFETSWDFKIYPLLLVNSDNCIMNSSETVDSGQCIVDSNDEQKITTHYKYISDAFDVWESFTNKQFAQLKANEEELNRIFIDIYGLQDELTPEVADKDVTIRKADRERDIKSFISYAIGCMFGRYSIDAEGLIYAGGDFSDKWVVGSEQCKVRKIEKDEDGNVISDSWVDATFMPDGDNVIPITEDEYFEDDIVSRFIEFVRTVYGEETLEGNLDFIADSIGRKPSETARQAIRRYFIKDFYKNHLKVYKKRPIYWMFESGKNDGFKALVYMHRYNEQTVGKVRTDYLHTLQRKYEGEIQRQQLIVDSEEYTVKDRTVAKKKIDRISKQIEECREYDQIVAHLANEKISIDLDDGVKVNYDKFQGVKVINSKDKEVKMDLLAKI